MTGSFQLVRAVCAESSQTIKIGLCADVWFIRKAFKMGKIELFLSVRVDLDHRLCQSSSSPKQKKIKYISGYKKGCLVIINLQTLLCNPAISIRR